MTTMTPPAENPKRGEIVLVLFPHSDLRTAKTRPVLIVQADELNTGLPQVIGDDYQPHVPGKPSQPGDNRLGFARRATIWPVGGFGCSHG